MPEALKRICRRATFLSWRVLFVSTLCCSIRALAHDPFEITSVVYVRSNRVEVFAEMEYRAAMALAGADLASLAGRDPATEFQSQLPSLTRAAGALLELKADGSPLTAIRTNVTLEVENHIRFAVDHAEANGRPLTASAPGLARLAAEGNYGIALTMLDMVNQKVLGQTVLFADTPAASFAPEAASKATPSPAQTIADTKPQESAPAISPAKSITEPETTAAGVIFWPVLLLVTVALALMVAWRLLGKSSVEPK